MKPLDDVVAVRSRPDGGAEIVSVATGEALIRLDDAAGLALADDLTRLLERPLRAVAA